MGLSIYDEVAPFWAASVLLPADVGNYITIVPAQKLPLRIDALELQNYDTIAHDTGWRVVLDGQTFAFAKANSAIMAGFAGNPRTDALTLIAPALLGCLILPVGVSLTWNAGATMLAGGSLTALVYGGYL